MSGRRAKQLRKAFIATHHRAPSSVEIRYWGDWSAPFKDTKTGRLVRKLLGAGTRRGVSEWRRLKRAYVRRRRGAAAVVAA